ncbi:MAG: hypothetical protein JNL05_13010 [Flavobacteriales bacterium]|nr:hypothetical protein [Flavobacteriales bacterium]
MTILLILTGARASGKTTIAKTTAGTDAFHCSGVGVCDDASAFHNAPSDRNWIIDGGGMSELDLERLASWAQNGQFPIERANGDVQQRLTPRFMIVDGYQF